MSAHRKPDTPEPVLLTHNYDDRPAGITEGTYDDRGHVDTSIRVVITRPIRNYPAFFAFAGAAVSFFMFTWLVALLVLPAAAFGYVLSQTAVREGKYLSIAGFIVAMYLILQHLAGA